MVECRCLAVGKMFLSQRGRITFTAVTKVSISNQILYSMRVLYNCI